MKYVFFFTLYTFAMELRGRPQEFFNAIRPFSAVWYERVCAWVSQGWSPVKIRQHAADNFNDIPEDMDSLIHACILPYISLSDSDSESDLDEDL